MSIHGYLFCTQLKYEIRQKCPCVHERQYVEPLPPPVVLPMFPSHDQPGQYVSPQRVRECEVMVEPFEHQSMRWKYAHSVAPMRFDAQRLTCAHQQPPARARSALSISVTPSGVAARVTPSGAAATSTAADTSPPEVTSV